MSDSERDGDGEIDALADKVAQKLDSGVYGDKVVIPRRQAMKIMGGTATLAGVLGFASGSAAGQSTGDESAGNVGTPEFTQDVWVDQLLDANDNEFLNVDPGEPINAQFGRNWVFDQINGGAPLSEGDGIERQIWVIANGASDPAGADPEDLIFEEEA